MERLPLLAAILEHDSRREARIAQVSCHEYLLNKPTRRRAQQVFIEADSNVEKLLYSSL
jgi:hypothetical protein